MSNDAVNDAVKLGLKMKRENDTRKAAKQDALAGRQPMQAHPDDMAVDRFAAAMKSKLAHKRAEGRGGWDDKASCSNELLSGLLRNHVEKGDPVDVGNLAMMIHQRGERIAALTGREA